MTILGRLLLECETDADALVAKLQQAAVQASLHDPQARRRLDDMADWLEDVAEELAALGGHPRDIPDYYSEVKR